MFSLPSSVWRITVQYIHISPTDYGLKSPGVSQKRVQKGNLGLVDLSYFVFFGGHLTMTKRDVRNRSLPINFFHFHSLYKIMERYFSLF